MPVQVNNNKFYNTFTPFIDEKTRSAEKTMVGRKQRKEFKPPYKFSKEFYNYLTAGGLLAFPVLAMAISQKNIFTAMKRTDTELFRLSMSENGGFFHGLSRKIALFKQNFFSRFLNFIQPLRKARENFTDKLNSPKNKNAASSLFQGINNIFKRFKTSAGHRKYTQLTEAFNSLEKTIEERLKLFEESASGKLKILFPKSLLKEGLEEIPRAVDVSKTKSGKNRAQEARRIMSEIKSLLGSKSKSYEQVLQRITFSCEDVFDKAESKLVSIYTALHKSSHSSANTDDIIKEIFKNLNGYRFAEKNEHMQNFPAWARRKKYISFALNQIKALKKEIPPQNRQVLSQISNLENLLSQKAKPENMGLLEKLRILLKCDDIKPDIIKGGKHSALFKLYSPEDYMLLKREITNFAQDLKFANKTQKHLLPKDIHEIDRGGVFAKALSVALPAGLLGVNIWNSKAGEEKAKSKRNFYSFIVGSAVMLASNYCTMNSQKRSIIYGILSAFLTSRLAERYIKK